MSLRFRQRHRRRQLLVPPPHRTDTAITIADLTGVGALDAALASAVLNRLLAQPLGHGVRP